MQCYTELTPPTAVSHVIYFPFVTPDSNNVIVAKTSVLQVFTWKNVQELESASEQNTSAAVSSSVTDRKLLENEDLNASVLSAEATVQQAGTRSLTKLVLIAEYDLSGTVTSLARVKLQHSKTGAEALLVASREAKLSLVEWDPDRNGLYTVSIHYYEQEETERSPWAPDLHRCANYLTVDPRSKCAALKFGSRNLAILPFRQAGDDLVMEDYDSDIDGERPDVASSGPVDDDLSTGDAPFTPSFVLPLTALDPSLIHLIHLAFLFEYRGPTFGILSSSITTSTSRLSERRDVVAYTVFTLDMEQRASTTILSVSDLPYDLYKVIPLPPPVGGGLLLGINEIVHVDQAGRANGVALNAFAKEASSFSMADQSELGLKLEDCTLEQMGTPNGEMLIILNNGDLAILDFKLDGRTVSGLTVRRVRPENGGLMMKGSATCAALLSKGRMFVGSEDGDSTLLGWSLPSSQLAKSKRQSGAAMDLGSDESLDEDAMDYDDDLYSAGDAVSQKPTHTTDVPNTQADGVATGDYIFQIHDSLVNIAPIHDVTFGEHPIRNTMSDPTTGQLSLMVASGRGRAGGVTMIRREVDPDVIGRFKLPNIQGIWSVSAKRPVPKALSLPPRATTTAQLDGNKSADAGFDRFIVVSTIDGKDAERSVLRPVTSTGFEDSDLRDTEWEVEGGTVDLGVLCRGTRIIQVLKSEVRSYDGDVGLAQIFPVTEEGTDSESQVLSASFADPYLLLIKDDHSIFLIGGDENGELEEVELPDQLKGLQWSSGCLYSDRDGAFGRASQGDSMDDREMHVKMFVVTTDGVMHVFGLPSLSRPLAVLASLNLLPPLLPCDSNLKRPAHDAEIGDIAVAELGDHVYNSAYLVLRTTGEEVIVYKPFLQGSSESGQAEPSLRFVRLPVHGWTAKISQANRETRLPPMRIILNIGGYSTVFIPGKSPGFLFKSAASSPKFLRLREKKVKLMSGFHSKGCFRGYIYVNDKGAVVSARLPSQWRYTELGWPIRRIPLGEEVQALSYHAPMKTYVLGAVGKNAFELPRDDELHRNWARESLSFTPEVDQGSVKLLTPVNWIIIDTYALPPQQVPLCIESVLLEVSEITGKRRQLIAVGTSNAVVADQPARGTIYIFDVIHVVPEPDRPETDRRLKLIAKEDVKGAVTALSEVGSQGFLLVAQGQKCMVRGLKEDGSLLPVAFLDMMCYVSVARALPGTGYCLMGDAVKGLWFVGYMEEPYKMTVFGKSTGQRLEVIAADFLPAGQQLYIVVADADANLHVLAYDPEHPKSLSGMHLLHLRSFHLGHFPTQLLRLPSSLAKQSGTTSKTQRSSAASTKNQILLTTQTGCLALLTLLPETSYRRLLSVQSQLLTSIDHACGLNPKSYRLGMGGLDSASGHPGGVPAAGGAPAAGSAAGGGTYVGSATDRAVLDGSLVARIFTDVDVVKRLEILSRAGTHETEVREDLRNVGAVDAAAGVLGYL